MAVASKHISRKERIRGEKLAILIDRNHGVPFEDGLARVNSENRVMASNSRISKAVFGKGERHKIRSSYWTGTMVAYVEPGKKLGEQIEYMDTQTGQRWVFPVPKAFRREKNAVLVTEHPDFWLEMDANNRVVHAKKVDLVENFPVKNGNYPGDPLYDIPIGKKVPFSLKSRELIRIDKCVGPIIRSGKCLLPPRFYDENQCDGDYRRIVWMDGEPASLFGVVTEAISGRVVKLRGISPEALNLLCDLSGNEITALLSRVQPEELEATIKLLRLLNNRV